MTLYGHMSKICNSGTDSKKRGCDWDGRFHRPVYRATLAFEIRKFGVAVQPAGLSSKAVFVFIMLGTNCGTSYRRKYRVESRGGD